MKPSVADELRRQTREQVLQMSAEARVELALALGDADVEIFAVNRGLSRPEARRIMKRRRQHGRTPSRCMEIPDE